MKWGDAMKKRDAVTLVEVLVAIFVMGIGLIALLTLFPIGMLRMAAAIHDARTAEAAYNADKLGILQNVRNDPFVISAFDANTIGFYPNGNIPDVFFNPYPKQPSGQNGLPNADPNAESYTILVDPIGFNSAPASAQDWVAGQPGVLRRRLVNFTTGATPAITKMNILQNFTLWDDINFESTIAGPGAPQTVANVVMRDSRFSWAYALRRPQTSDRSVVNLTIIVFDKRALSLGTNLALAESVYPGTPFFDNTLPGGGAIRFPGQAYFNPANNTIIVDYAALNAAAPPPPLRPGNWIMDSTVYVDSVTKFGSSSDIFYRIVSAEQVMSASLGRVVARYEVQTPIRGVSKYPVTLDPGGSGVNVAQGTVTVLEGVAEVFEKGAARLP